MRELVASPLQFHKASRVPSGCFSAAFVAGYFETLHTMHAASGRSKGHTALSVDGSGWRLLK